MEGHTWRQTNTALTHIQNHTPQTTEPTTTTTTLDKQSPNHSSSHTQPQTYNY